MRDKTADDRFFILTLFGIAMEAERQAFCKEDTILQVSLPVGLPPKHYGALYQKFQKYFSGRGRQSFTYKGKAYTIEIEQVSAFPQDYAAAMTIYPKISEFNKVVTVDIGGFTLDYLLIRSGKPDLSACDSLEKGVITLYNKVISRINSEHDILLEDSDVDRIIREEKTDYGAQIQKTVREMTRTYVDDLLGTLRERGIDLKTGCVVFIGGGALLLREYLEHSEKIGRCVFYRRYPGQCKRLWAPLPDPEERQVTAMGKKNAFVTTIGFNKNDPNHVAVAELLNSMKRGKAQYIVNAVLAWQNGENPGEAGSVGLPLDYEKIRRFVLQVLDERERQGNHHEAHMENQMEQETEEMPGGMELELDEGAMAGILSSLEAFKG